MTSYLKFYKTGKSGKTLLWVLFLVVLLHKLLPNNVTSSWEFMIIGFSRVYMLIKWRPFMYVFVNFIIVSIFISSSNITHKLSNLLQKVHKKSSHNISTLISQTSQKFLVPFDDDTTWWSRVVNNEERGINPTTLDESRVYEENDEKTTSFEVKEEEKNDVFDVNTHVGCEEEVVVDDDEVEEEFDTLDDTWKAIMEAKNKGSGPHLKKSGTWTAGDRGGGGGCGGEEVVGKVGKGGRLSRYKVELKKWKTFNREVVQEKKPSHGGRGGGGDGGGGGGGGRGRGPEVGLTYHDDLKKRADAFIAKVTHDMRLQRMESDQRFLNTINRGSK